MQRKIKVWHKFTSKQKGSSLYLMIPIILLFVMVLFYVNNYTRAADIVADNFKTSLDAANLSVTVVNVEKMVHVGSLTIIGEINESSELSDYETYIVRKRFETFEKTLQSNIGLKDDFSFSGGTCGWAANQIVARKEVNGKYEKGTLTIDSFVIYDIAGDTVYAYEISNVTQFINNDDIIITKTIAGSVSERNINNQVVSSTAFTKEGIMITTPTVFSEVSFLIEPPRIVDFEWVDYSSVESDPEIAEYIRGEKRVSRTSTTSIKYNN